MGDARIQEALRAVGVPTEEGEKEDEKKEEKKEEKCGSSCATLPNEYLREN